MLITTGPKNLIYFKPGDILQRIKLVGNDPSFLYGSKYAIIIDCFDFNERKIYYRIIAFLENTNPTINWFCEEEYNNEWGKNWIKITLSNKNK